MVLGTLSEARGISGQEDAVRAVVRDLVPEGLDVRADALGNLVVSKVPAQKGPRLLVVAHMDEVGFMVTGFTDEGKLRFRPVGGVDARIVPGLRLSVGRKAIEGVVGLAPAHLTRQAERKTLDFDELSIDIGASGRGEAEKAVRIGDMVTFSTTFTETEGGYLGKAFDDRAGCFLALQCLKESLDFPLYVAFTVQEEVGLRGARVIGRQIPADAVLVLEATVASDVAGAEKDPMVSSLGAGPVLSVVDGHTLYDRRLTEATQRLAQELGVPCQIKRAAIGGNDAGAIWGEGTRPVALSLPCRYLHSPCSVLLKEDMEAAGTLIAGFLHGFREVVAR